MSRRVRGASGVSGLTLPGGWVLDDGDIVVVSDEEWDKITGDLTIVGLIDDLGTTTEIPDPVPTWRDIQRTVSQGNAGLEAEIEVLETVVTDHLADTINVHGIPDTSLLETVTGSQNKADQAEADAKAYTDTHAADTTDVHGIADTSLLATKDYVDTTSAHSWEAVYNFATPTDSWVIPHGRGTQAIHVETFDNNDHPLEGNVLYPDLNTVRIEYYYAQAGYARAWALT